jgi:hypothetical protein
MIDDNRRSQLEMRWVPVTDPAGRTRMEAVWIVPTASASVHHAA